MKTVSVRELKAHWVDVEEQLGQGEMFVVLNRGRPAAHIVPATPREVLVWDDHLATALRPSASKSPQETVRMDRDPRW